MAFSAEIIAKLGLDTANFATSLTASEGMLGKFEARLEKFGINFNPGEKIARESAKVFQEVATAQERLAGIQADRTLKVQAGHQHEIVLQREILALKADIDKMEGQTVAKVEAQILLEQKLLQLETAIARQKTAGVVGGGAGSGASAGSSFGSVATEAAKANTVLGRVAQTMNKLVSVSTVLKGTVTALGVAALAPFLSDKLARAVTGVSEKEEEGLKDMAASSDELSAKQTAAAEARLSSEQLYQLRLTEEAAIQRKLDEVTGSTSEKNAQRNRLNSALIDKQRGAAEALAQFNEATSAKASADEEHRKDIADQFAKAKREQDEANEKRALELEDESFQFAKDHREQLELEAKVKTGTINPAERLHLDIIQLQNKEMQTQVGLQYLLTKPIKDWDQADKERFLSLQSQSRETAKQLQMKQALVESTIKQAEAEAKVAGAIKMSSAAIDGFIKTQGEADLRKGLSENALVTFGDEFLGPKRHAGDFANTSAPVLNEEIRRYNQLLMRLRDLTKNFTGAPDLASGDYARALAISQVEQNRQLALRELQQRNSLQGRSYDQALRGYQGDPLNFDRAYQDANRKDMTEQTAVLRSIDEQFKKGIVLVQTGSGG